MNCAPGTSKIRIFLEIKVGGERLDDSALRNFFLPLAEAILQVAEIRLAQRKAGVPMTLKAEATRTLPGAD